MQMIGKRERVVGPPKEKQAAVGREEVLAARDSDTQNAFIKT